MARKRHGEFCSLYFLKLYLLFFRLISHLVTALPGPLLSEVLLSSPILAGEDGAPLAPMGQGFEFGIDPAEDPELAMVSPSHTHCVND